MFSQIKISLADYVLEVVTALMLVASIVITVIAYSNLPETIPTHYNLLGEVDGWGGKSVL